MAIARHQKRGKYVVKRGATKTIIRQRSDGSNTTEATNFQGMICCRISSTTISTLHTSSDQRHSHNKAMTSYSRRCQNEIGRSRIQKKSYQNQRHHCKEIVTMANNDDLKNRFSGVDTYRTTSGQEPPQFFRQSGCRWRTTKIYFKTNTAIVK